MDCCFGIECEKCDCGTEAAPKSLDSRRSRPPPLVSTAFAHRLWPLTPLVACASCCFVVSSPRRLVASRASSPRAPLVASRASPPLAPRRLMGYIPLAQRAQACTLLSAGLPRHVVAAKCQILVSSGQRLYREAQQRGWRPNDDVCPLLEEYIADKPRSGRPTKRTNSLKRKVVEAVRRDRYGREKTCASIADSLGVSAMTVWRVLKSLYMLKTKPTRKPGLTQGMKFARL